MKNTTTRSIAILAATGALLGGGAAAASATGDDGDSHVGDQQRGEVAQLVHEAVEDGVVTTEEEDAIKQAIEDHTGLEFESLDDAVAPQG